VLDRLQAFASEHGADFYRLPRNTGRLTLVKTPWEVPRSYPFGTETLVPLRAGEHIGWQLSEQQ
jgi:dihydroorotase